MVIHGSAEVIARIGFGVAEEAVQRDETGFVAVHIKAKFVVIGAFQNEHLRRKISAGKRFRGSRVQKILQRLPEAGVLRGEVGVVETVAQNEALALVVRKVVDESRGRGERFLQPVQGACAVFVVGYIVGDAVYVLTIPRLRASD